jgi:membrane-associated phospholipid phosphatase
VVERWLARLDRVPGLGGGRTHVVFLALFFAVSFSCYLLVLKVRGPSKAFETWVGWDEAFPFRPTWIWLYLPPFVVGPLLTAVMRRDVFAWYVRRATLVVVVSLAIFAVLPSHTRRPAAGPAFDTAVGDDLTGRLYRWMIEIDDPPANAAPSLHVSLSCLLAWALAFNYPRWWPAALAAAVLVWLATLYTRQHHLLDVVSGALLASLAAVGPPVRPDEGSQPAPPPAA